MQLYTIKEVAGYLKVTTRTVYNMIATDKIKAVKIGKATRINQEELDRITKGE